ncbi:MAG: DUF814 domain-containing protein [Ignavibacteria bacterium]|nr:DUF814 domain-containing protein [Ignavibacteria bacterium]
MFKNYYILRDLSQYLNKELTGFIFSESISQEKDKLIIILTRKKSVNVIKYLEYSCDRKIPFLILRGSFSKARKNYAELFRECNKKEITGVSLLNDDRLIRIIFSDDTFLVYNFIPYKYNMFFVKEGSIVTSFKSNKEIIGKNIDSLFQKITKPEKKKKTTFKSYLKNLNEKLGELYIKEILARSLLNENDELNIKCENVIRKNYNDIIHGINNPEYILYNTGDEYVISLVKLQIMEKTAYEKFADINSLLEKYLKETMKQNYTAEIKRKLVSEITRKIKYLEHKKENLILQKKNALNYKIWLDYGNIILSNIGRISFGDSSFDFNNEEGNINCSIRLDTKLTPSQNAQKYFDKYKKQKESINLINDKISSTEKELLKLNGKLLKIEIMQNFKDLKAEEKKELSNQDETESKRFRKFILDENFQVWVGKNSKSNELLTFKYANQNDLWFHIRGFSGSHTVLKKSSKNLKYPKEIIKIAAAIAAYYSKARNSGTIPVAYTERKYVKKGKRFKEGSVIMEREKVVFIKPGLPYEE